MDPIQNPTNTPIKKMSKRTKAALWCLIGPTALYIIVFIVYIITNLILANSGVNTNAANSEDLFGTASPLKSALNIVMFLTGAIAFLTWLPGIIVGIILLATKKPTTPQA